MVKVVLIAVAICLAAVAMIRNRYAIGAWVARALSTEDHVLLSQQLIRCQELSSVRYMYADTVPVKKDYKTLWLIPGKEYVMVKLAVTVRAGVKDMGDAWFSVSDDGRDVFVAVPPCQVLSSVITEQVPLIEQRKHNTNISLDDVMGEVTRKKDDIVRQTINDGILDNAAKHSRMIVENLLLAAGFKGVTVFCDGTDKETSETAAIYRKEAEKTIEETGSAEADSMSKKQQAAALYRLGRCLLTGEGVEKNAAEAVQCFEKSSVMDNAAAMTAAGLCYLHGDGIGKDDAKALEYFNKALKMGSAMAAREAALCNFYGLGTERDEYAAFELLTKASGDGDVAAQRWVGLYYLLGLGGIDENDDTAMDYLRAASDAGDGEAKVWRALLWIEKNGRYYAAGSGGDEGVKLLREAALGGEVSAYYPLALCYLEGVGVAADKGKAASYLNKAADAKDKQGFSARWAEEAKQLLAAPEMAVNSTEDDARIFSLLESLRQGLDTNH